MDNINELKQTANDLRKQGKFDEAVKFYEKLWQEHRGDCNEWDGWGYAFCLRKVKKTALAYEISQEVYKTYSDFDANKGVLAWCMYDLSINRETEEIEKDESSYFGTANKILSLVPQDKYSPYSKTVFKVTDYLEETRNILPARDINTWLDRLDKTKLGKDTWEGKDHKGRPMTHASDLEKWYAKKCKMYYELKRFRECIDVGLEAFSVITEFHYHYDKWIRRDMGRSYGELGNPKDGIALYEKFMDERSEWFIYFEAANLYYQDNQIEMALKFSAQAALVRHEIEHKVNLFAFIGKVLLHKGEKELACKHLLLSVKIRLEREWKIPGDLQTLLDQADVNMDEPASPKDLEQSLIKYWQSLLYSDKKQGSGVVKKVVASGKSGFIIGNDKKEYHFRVNEFHGNPSSLRPGLRVSFYIAPSNEPEKLDSAVNVTVVKE